MNQRTYMQANVRPKRVSDPVEHFRFLAREIARALEDAGTDPSRRIEAAEAAVELAGALGEVMTGWKDEAAGAPNSATSGGMAP